MASSWAKTAGQNGSRFVESKTMTYDIHQDPELDDVLHRLIEDYGAECVILYGSKAAGSADAHSDTDLVVIKETSLPFFDRLAEVARVCRWKRARGIGVHA
jgi:predicted nucleotidyltransferase